MRPMGDAEVIERKASLHEKLPDLKLVFFDATTHFPVLSLTFDPTGREVDFYCFDRFQLDVKMDDDDFNPDKLWGKKP